MRVRFIGLDVHLDFCEVAICEAGRVRSGGRVATSSEGLAILANSLGGDDYVALEATGNALAIARRLEPCGRAGGAGARLSRGGWGPRGGTGGQPPGQRKSPPRAPPARGRGCS